MEYSNRLAQLVEAGVEEVCHRDTFLPLIEEANANWKFSVPWSYYGRVTNVEKTKVYKGDELSHLMAVDT